MGMILQVGNSTTFAVNLIAQLVWQLSNQQPSVFSSFLVQVLFSYFALIFQLCTARMIFRLGCNVLCLFFLLLFPLHRTYCSLCTGLTVTVVGQFYTNDGTIHKKFAKISEELTASTSSIKPEDGRRHLHEYRIL
jgi:hypothetical protein